MHVSTAFTIVGIFSILYLKFEAYDLLWPIAGLIVLGGVIASARLDLKAHNLQEISLGVAYGLLSGIVSSYFLI